MNNRKLFFDFIVILILPFLGILIDSTDLVGLAHAAPGPAVLAERPGLAVSPVIFPPSDIMLSNNSVAENQPSGTTVGTFTTIDLDLLETHTYALVDTITFPDNVSFTIEGDVLKTTAIFDRAVKSNYSIRVRSTGNNDSQFLDKSFTITIANVNEAPTGINLSNNSVAENQPNGTTVGTFSSADPDSAEPGSPNTHTYSLVAGPGSANNNSFTIAGNTLSTAAAFDYEVKNSYSIRVRTTDNGGLTSGKIFAIIITNANDAPTSISLSNTGVAEQQPVGTTVGAFSSADQDSGDSHTYSLVSGPGSADNSSFTIVGNTLKTAAVFNYAVKKNYSIRAHTTDSSSATFNQIFTVRVIPRTYLPLIINPAPLTELSVFNDNTGGDITFTVLGVDISCTVPNNTTLFCGRFESGTYDIYVTSLCGSISLSRTYEGGPQTSRVFCY